MKNLTGCFQRKKKPTANTKKMKKEMRDYQITKQNVDTFYANEKRLRAEEELKKKIRHRDKQAGQSS